MKKKLIVAICVGIVTVFTLNITSIALENDNLSEMIEDESVKDEYKYLNNQDIIDNHINSEFTNIKNNEVKDNNSEKKETIYNVNELDDKKLDITLEQFLENKKSNPDLYSDNSLYNNERVNKISNSVNIIETNFKWNGNLDLRNKPNSLVLHHIEASRPGQTIPVTDLHQWHLNNGWTGIGYHFYITKDGRIYRGRPEEAIGAHAQGRNTNTLGIAVEGKYQIEDMPEIQRASVIKLGQYLRQKYKISEVLGHRDVNSTDCPGKNYPFTTIKNEILNYIIKDDEIQNNRPLVNQSFKVKYSVHGQDYGWQDYVSNGEVAGTTGQYKRIEGIKINLENAPQDLGISYRTHSADDEGWRDWKNNGELSGTTGESRRMEAIQINLTGKMAKNYSVEYRVHGEDYGWQPWVRNGETAGTLGEWKRIEAIEIRVVKNNNFGVDYQAQGQDYGWKDYVSDGQLAGTTGQYRRLEGIKIKLRNTPHSVGIRYRTHVEGEYGFRPWKYNNELAGTVAEYRRMEAIQIELTGSNANKYSIEYRVHGEDYGWQPWVRNGEIAGTLGMWKRIEGIEIRVVEN